jgi:hypothetical protein
MTRYNDCSDGICTNMTTISTFTILIHIQTVKTHTFHLIPVCTIGDSSIKMFWWTSISTSHKRMSTRIHSCKMFEQFMIWSGTFHTARISRSNQNTKTKQPYNFKNAVSHTSNRNITSDDTLQKTQNASVFHVRTSYEDTEGKKRYSSIQ